MVRFMNSSKPVSPETSAQAMAKLEIYKKKKAGEGENIVYTIIFDIVREKNDMSKVKPTKTKAKKEDEDEDEEAA